MRGQRRDAASGRAREWSSPARLRAWAAALILASLAVFALVATSVAGIHGAVHTIGDEAAPQAADASDLYFALSDLDAQVARQILAGSTDTLASTEFDATRAFNQRVTQVDRDLEQATAAGDAATRRLLGELMDDLTFYQGLAGNALVIDENSDNPPGRPPESALSYYYQATDMMHLHVIPLAEQLRTANDDALDHAYDSRHTTAIVVGVLAVVFGLGLGGAFVVFQTRLSRKYRRSLNPTLLAAMLLSATVAIVAGAIFLNEASLLNKAVRTQFQPYLVSANAETVSAQAEADTVRYILGPELSFGPDFKVQAKRLSSLLQQQVASATSGEQPTARAAVDRWNVYANDNQQIIALDGAGQLQQAVTVATGITRGQAAFDYYFYTKALDTVTANEQRAFAGTIGAAHGDLDGWTVLPAVATAITLLLIFAGVRPRLAEYR